LEKVFRYHLKNLSKMILDDGIVYSPVIADRKNGIVLDGSHRYIFFLMNGFRELPVRFVDYDDEHIRVGSRLIHRLLVEEKVEICKEEVTRRGLIGDLFSPRSTRHFFPFRKNERINVPLKLLKKGKKIDVEKYISKCSYQDEIHHNKKYLSEIETEFDELIRYMEEVRQTKNYLKSQILMMQENAKPVAFFPGKFQPVHMGHITSLMRIFDDYDKIIICITSDSPNMLSYDERKKSFQSVLSKFIKIEYFFLETALVNIEDINILPTFDVCVSGNESVIDFMESNNFKTRLLGRSQGVGYSGTQLRSISELKST